MSAILESKTLKSQERQERESVEDIIKFINKKEYLLFIEGTLDDFYRLDEQKAEYLEGIITMQSPASLTHEEIFGDILMQMRSFIKEKNLGRVLGSRFTILLDKQYRFEPDIVFISNENKGVFTEYEFVGGPDLVVEIVSKSTKKYDLIIKRELYSKYRVKELYFIDPIDKLIYVDFLENDNYKSVSLKPGKAFESKVIEGFKVKVEFWKRQDRRAKRGVRDWFGAKVWSRRFEAFRMY